MGLAGLWTPIVSAAGTLVGIIPLDLDGYFTGTEFLTILANAISAVLLALFNTLTFGTAA